MIRASGALVPVLPPPRICDKPRKKTLLPEWLKQPTVLLWTALLPQLVLLVMNDRALTYSMSLRSTGR